MQDMTQRQHKFLSVALGDMTVSERAQRAFRQARVDQILGELDLNAFGEPVLSFRDGRYYIIDGQHRIKALGQFLGTGWERQQILCKVYEGMTEQDEARLFRQLNTVLGTTAYDKFKVAVTEGREEETRIKAIVEAAGLHVSRARKDSPGAISAISALRNAYSLSPKSLMFSLKLASESYGDAGMEAAIIEGLAQLHNRYDKALDDEMSVEALSHARGGVKGLINAAQKRRLTTGNSLAICVAAEAVDVINRYRKGKKLPSWWASAAA
jgi:hypothetical protein